jgi:hypothetical protein
LKEQINLADSVNELYETTLKPKEFAFVFAGYAGILFRTKDKMVLFEVELGGYTAHHISLSS